jgi:hypothetical protein
MPNTISQNKFAVACGVSRQGIAFAVKNKLVAVYNKKINIDHRSTCEYFHGKTGKQLDVAELMKKKKRKKATPKAEKPKPPAKKPALPPEPPPEEITAPVDDPLDNPDDQEPDNGYTLPPGIECFEDITIHNLHLIPQDLIKKIKEFETAAKAKQAREFSRGELIKRKDVASFCAQLHTVDTNQWKTLEDKLMPSLCGIFDVQDGGPESIKARKLIKDEVTKILEYSKRIIDEFLVEEEGK